MTGISQVTMIPSGGGTIADFIRAKQERERHEKKK